MKTNAILPKLLTAFVIVLFAALGIFASLYTSNLHAQKTQITDSFFATQLAPVPALANGATKPLADYRNQVLVVNFWATWCAPCVQEMPELSALQTELGKDKVRFIGIGIDSPDALAEFAAKYKITYPLYLGGMSGTQLSTALGNKAGGLPFTVIINKSGDVVKTVRGKVDMKELKRDILAVK